MEELEANRREAGQEYSVCGILRYLGLSRSGYYSHKERKDRVSKQEQRKREIMDVIADIYYDSRKIYGAPKIWQILRLRGYQVALKTVSNYMREMGLRACYIKPYIVTTTDPDFDERLKNYLQENYNPDKPNQVWCSDITYIHTEDGFCYLTSIMDLFSRRIIAWRLSTTLEAKWLVECIEEAIAKRRGARPAIFHSDRGSQYISQAVLNCLEGVKCSYSRKASPWQNACIESFHALLKREWLYRFKIQSYDHAYRLVFEYIEAFYNTVRIHSHCDYQSPQQYEELFMRELDRLEKQIA